jgi:hypothetical protein
MYEDDKANQSLTDDVVLPIAIEKERAFLTLNRKHYCRGDRLTNWQRAGGSGAKTG